MGFFEAAILYIFGHIPANAYAIMAAPFKQEFKHPKIKHPNGIPKCETLHLTASKRDGLYRIKLQYYRCFSVVSHLLLLDFVCVWSNVYLKDGFVRDMFPTKC